MVDRDSSRASCTIFNLRTVSSVCCWGVGCGACVTITTVLGATTVARTCARGACTSIGGRVMRLIFTDRGDFNTSRIGRDVKFRYCGGRVVIYLTVQGFNFFIEHVVYSGQYIAT